MHLYFREPQELLDLFAKLEAENLGLIQQCQEAEARLEAGREVRAAHGTRYYTSSCT